MLVLWKLCQLSCYTAADFVENMFFLEIIRTFYDNICLELYCTAEPLVSLSKVWFQLIVQMEPMCDKRQIGCKVWTGFQNHILHHLTLDIWRLSEAWRPESLLSVTVWDAVTELLVSWGSAVTQLTWSVAILRVTWHSMMSLSLSQCHTMLPGYM